MSKSVQNSLNLAARVLFVVLFLPAGISKLTGFAGTVGYICLLYTSPSPRDGLLSRMPSSA